MHTERPCFSPWPIRFVAIAAMPLARAYASVYANATTPLSSNARLDSGGREWPYERDFKRLESPGMVF